MSINVERMSYAWRAAIRNDNWQALFTYNIIPSSLEIISISLRNEGFWLATEACHSLLTLHCCTPPFHQAITEQGNSYPDNRNITEKKRDG